MPRRVDPDEPQDVMTLTKALVAAADGVTAAFVAAQGMHATDVEALVTVLDAHGSATPMTPGLLGRELGLSSGAVTALVDRLEGADVLRRVRDVADRRRILLEVSDEGHAVADRYLAPLLGDGPTRSSSSSTTPSWRWCAGSCG